MPANPIEHAAHAMTTASTCARLLRDSLALPGDDGLPADTHTAAMLWADSGAMALTGKADSEPLPCPAPLAACAQGAWHVLASLADGALDPGFPAHRLLGERAAIAGFSRNGAISAGGVCRILPALDGALALNLPRDDDWRLLPAWLEASATDWDEAAAAVREREASALIERGRLLGLAVAPLAAPPSRPVQWFHHEAHATPRDAKAHDVPVVLDLGALWAAPLCASVLGMLGARVIKVESVQRPDGGRFGPAAFFDLMNAGKESVALDLRTMAGRTALSRLLERADIVIESARPRALEQMGIHAADLVRASVGKTWISITGYGRAAPMRDWIAYGDDAGVAAGLSALLRDACGQTVFCADAIADPLAGLHAALLAWHAWRSGRGGLFDVSLHAVASHCATLHAVSGAQPDEALSAAPPVARVPHARAAELGVDTARVLREFGCA